MAETAEIDAMYRVALGHYDRDEPQRAAAMFGEVLRRAPGHVEASFKLGNLHKEAGRLDDAIRLYAVVLKGKPDHAEALNNMGAAYQAKGALDRAESCYRAAIASKPLLVQPRLNLGRLLQDLGRDADAATAYRSAMDNGHEIDVFGHLLAAAEGKSHSRAPDAYVRETFNTFASSFDEWLVNELDYGVPRRLAALVRERAGERLLDTLDLGCGTGLCAVALKGGTGSLTGVDLSPLMLEESRKRGLYDRLELGEIGAWLGAAPGQAFDLVMAADVFIYSGDLGDLFRNIARCLKDGGLFAFSVESCSGDDWRLLRAGRYAQSRAYLERLAGAHGFRILACEDTTIRKGIAGELWLLERGAAVD